MTIPANESSVAKNGSASQGVEDRDSIAVTRLDKGADTMTDAESLAKADELFKSDAMTTQYRFSRALSTDPGWVSSANGITAEGTIQNGLCPVGYTRDDVTCKHAVEATTSTIISGITLSSSSEAGTIELNACFHCQRSATPSQCGIRKLQVTHDGTIRLSARVLAKSRAAWPSPTMTRERSASISTPRKKNKSDDLPAGYDNALKAISQQLKVCYLLEDCQRPGIDVPQILSRLMEAAKLPAITDRDERLAQQKALHVTEMAEMMKKLSTVEAELQKSRAHVTRLDIEVKAAPKLDKIQGAGLAVVALSSLDKSRSSKVAAFIAFQPYALSFVANRSFTLSRPLFLPTIDSVLKDLTLAKEDVETDTNAPPLLLGGRAGDATDVRNVLESDISQLRAVISDVNQPYEPALLSLLWRRLQIHGQNQTPSGTNLFSDVRRSVRHFVGADDFANDAIRDNSAVIGLLYHGKFPNVYSWHPLEKLLVVYTWSSLEEANVDTPLDDDKILKAMNLRSSENFKSADIRVEYRRVFLSTTPSFIGPLTVRLIEALMNRSVSIDIGIALSSSALYAAQEPTEADILKLKLEHMADLVSDFNLSRELWKAMEAGQLY